MLKAILGRLITGLERRWNYDASYMREVLDVSPWALIRFGMVGTLGHGRRAPAEAIAAAGIVGTLAEDCGPCTQISTDMARAAGVSDTVLRGILAGDAKAMGDTSWLAWRFARCVIARDMVQADPLRDEIVRRWGKAGLVDIGMAITTARLYPTLKYALGHGRTCSRITVDGDAVPVAREPSLAA